ncbi:MAG: sulfite exporter TauE/SafE family protein [Methylobacteriaceae bacterium]|nr:sulfite exporter TauE/SafE family protein [Methylobacteriaceae bacterium]
MGAGEILLLLTLGLAAGVVSTIAGGAGILVYPGLVFLGLSPVAANATTYVALAPAVFVAAWVERAQTPAVTPPTARAHASAFVGTLVGAAALTATGEAAFRLIVPAMLGLATALFWLAPDLHRRMARGGGERFGPGVLAAFFAGGVYSGYFGTGFGILLLALLRFAGVEDILRANRMKNLMGATTSLAGIGFFFGATELVSWPHGAVVIAGNIVGGALGARLAQIVPAEAIRRFVVGFGATLTIVFAWRNWIAP